MAEPRAGSESRGERSACGHRAGVQVQILAAIPSQQNAPTSAPTDANSRVIPTKPPCTRFYTSDLTPCVESPIVRPA